MMFHLTGLSEIYFSDFPETAQTEFWTLPKDSKTLNDKHPSFRECFVLSQLDVFTDSTNLISSANSSLLLLFLVLFFAFSFVSKFSCVLTWKQDNSSRCRIGGAKPTSNAKIGGCVGFDDNCSTHNAYKATVDSNEVENAILLKSPFSSFVFFIFQNWHSFYFLIAKHQNRIF